MAFFLGLDIGTSGAKALLINSAGAVIARAVHEYPLHTPHPQWSEQDPADWWRGAAAAIQDVLSQSATEPGDVACVGMTGQMHGLVLLDAKGEPVRRAILWNDQRTAVECDAIHDRLGAEQVIAVTGKPALTGFTAPKVLWVRTHERSAFDRAAHLLLPKDYVRFKLSGTHAIDVADASGTGFFDVSRRAWADEVVEALDIPRSWLPPVFESPEVCAAVDAAGAAATGLREGTPIVAGAGDQAAEAVGCGIVVPGRVSVTIGTSGVVFAATDTPRIDAPGRLHTYCHAIPERWHMMGVMLSAGGSLRWYRDTLAASECADAEARGVDPYEVILECAAASEPGAGGVTFLPYLTGERTPYADPDARGAFLGLTLRTSRKDLARAVIEGITFGLRDALELVTECALPIDSIRVSGGGTRSPIWRQILADIFDAPVTTVTAVEGAAYGAALLAGVGAGAWPDVDAAAEATVQEIDGTIPTANDRHKEAYRAAYAQYRSFAERARK